MSTTVTEDMTSELRGSIVAVRSGSLAPEGVDFELRDEHGLVVLQIQVKLHQQAGAGGDWPLDEFRDIRTQLSKLVATLVPPSVEVRLTYSGDDDAGSAD